MMYIQKPKSFQPKFDVVSCFLEHDKNILLLHRQDHKPEGNTWGVPAGKVDIGENVSDTMVREITEETGLQLLPSKLSYFKEVYVQYPDYHFIYHIYHSLLEKKHEVVINKQEHKNYRWVTPVTALQMPLIPDEDACIKLFYKI